MANLSELVKDDLVVKEGIKSTKAQKGRKRFWNDEDSIASSDEKKKDEDANYEKKLKVLEAKLKEYESSTQLTEASSVKLTKNEHKLLEAIRSEITEQGLESPVIGRNKLKNEYKINQRYLDDSIRGLESKGLINREKVAYSPSSYTHKWSIT